MHKFSKLCLLSLVSTLLAQDPLSAACGPWGCDVGGGGYGGGSSYHYPPQGAPHQQHPGYGYPPGYQQDQGYYQQRSNRGRPFNQGIRRQYHRHQSYYNNYPNQQDQGYYGDYNNGSDQYDDQGYQQGYMQQYNQSGYQQRQGYYRNEPAQQGYYRNEPAQQGYYRNDPSLTDDQGYYQSQQSSTYQQRGQRNEGQFGQTYQRDDQNIDQSNQDTRNDQAIRGDQTYYRSQDQYRNESSAPQSYPLEGPETHRRMDQRSRQNPNNPQQDPNYQSYQKHSHHHDYYQTALNDQDTQNDKQTSQGTSSYERSEQPTSSRTSSDRMNSNQQIHQAQQNGKQASQGTSSYERSEQPTSSQQTHNQTSRAQGWSQDNEEENDDNETLLQVIADDESLSSFSQALQSAGLKQTLEGRGPYTIFVPDNDAFQNLPATQRQELFKPENKQKLANLLSLHIIPGKHLSTDIKTGKMKTINGKEIHIHSDGSKISVNNKALVTKSDIDGSNGVIHIIDTVILP
jgi:uncharacterized surface protein with fasciclin (FAS1) repeats